jgi:hypothetical protein
MAEGDSPPAVILPPPSPRKYRTRRGIAEWRRGAGGKNDHERRDRLDGSRPGA